MGDKSRPPMLLVAAVVLAAEALALFVYTVLTVIAVATDQAYTVANGVAQIVLQLIMLTGLALLASGVARLRPWTRTPSVMVQLIIGFVAVVLLQGHRYEWGVPILLLAAAGLAGLLTPASLKALARPMPGPPQQAPRSSGKSGNPAKRNAAGKPNPSPANPAKPSNPAKSAKPSNPAKSAKPSKPAPAKPAKADPSNSAQRGKPVSRRS